MASKKAKTLFCACGDPGCPCKGRCCNEGTVILYRSDMEDDSGVLFCEDCANDAMESGVFNDSPTDEGTDCPECGEELDTDCMGGKRCTFCHPCPHCFDGGYPVVDFVSVDDEPDVDGNPS